MEEDPQGIKFTQKHFLQKTVIPDGAIDLLISMHSQFHLALSDLLQESNRKFYSNQSFTSPQSRDNLWKCINANSN